MPGLAARGCSTRFLLAPCGWVDGGSGWLRRWVEVIEEALPWCLPGPVPGEVEPYFPCARSYSGRDVDEFAADRAGPCLFEVAGSEEPGGAGEVVGDDRGVEPGRVGGKNT